MRDYSALKRWQVAIRLYEARCELGHTEFGSQKHRTLAAEILALKAALAVKNEKLITQWERGGARAAKRTPSTRKQQTRRKTR